MSGDARRAEVEQQLSTLSILQSVYCMDGEFTTPEDTASVLDAFSNGEELSSQSLHVALQATLSISLQDAASRVIGLSISWNSDKARSAEEGTAEELQLRLKQPNWLSKKNFEQLSDTFQLRLADLLQEEADDQVALVAIAVEAAHELSLQAAASVDQSIEEGTLKSSDTASSDSLV